VDPAEANQLVDEARVQIKKTLEEARQAVWDLRHPEASDSSIPVLFDLARKLGDKHGIQIDTEITGAGALTPDIDRTILLVGREAVSNAVAHAHASRIGIRLSYGPASVKLEVTDNGRGFMAQREESLGRRHFGLIGMRERAESAGGSFAIQSSPGEGTRVTATLPVVTEPIAPRFLSEAP
jgi:signal transduction histidine kinase